MENLLGQLDVNYPDDIAKTSKLSPVQQILQTLASSLPIYFLVRYSVSQRDIQYESQASDVPDIQVFYVVGVEGPRFSAL